MEIMHKGMWTGWRVLYLSVDAIRANPDQPRKYFEPEALRELAESIGRYGILQPLTVRRGEDGYELIAGERRLRAAKLAGLREVPCLAVRSDEEESALLSLIENLQRQDLHYMEEAAAIAKLIAVYGLSQEQAAERLGKSQSAVANKLRLLRLSPACVTLLREGGLSERHARALLRLSDENERLAALRVIIERGCNVAQAEAYIESVLQRAAVTPPRWRQGGVGGGVLRCGFAARVWMSSASEADVHREGCAAVSQLHPAEHGHHAARGGGRGVRAGGHGRGDPADHPHPAHGGCQNGVKIVTKSLLFFAKSMLYCNRLAVVYTAGY